MRYNQKTPTNLYFVVHALPRKPQLALRVLRFSLAKMFGRRVIRGIDLAVTYACNLKCAHCNVAANHAFRKREELDESEIVEIIRQLQRIGGFYVTFTGGEPLVKIDLLERVINKIGKNEMLWQVQSNGVLLDDDLCRRLRRIGVDNVQLSFDLYHESDSWEEVLKIKQGQIYMLKKWGLRPVFTWLASHETIADQKQIEDVIRFSADNKVVVGWNFAVPQGRWQEDNHILLSPEDSSFIRKTSAENRYIFIDLENNLVDYGCPAFSERFHVNAYGDVQPCTFFQIAFGNIRQEPLQTIWQRGLQFPLFANFPPNCPPAEDAGFLERWFELNEEAGRTYPIPYQEFFKTES